MGSYDAAVSGARRRAAPALVLIAAMAASALLSCNRGAVGVDGELAEMPAIRRPDLLESTAPLLPFARPRPAEAAGLVVQTLAPGSGEAIEYGEIGRFHVIGSLASGKSFQNTYEEGAVVLRLLPPAVPPGFALGAAGMTAGERRRVEVPPALGYGDEGEPRLQVPPGARLLYEIDLISVVRDLEVRVLREGSASEPPLELGDSGTFAYTGVLASDGTVFDSSPPGEPRSFPLRQGGLIRGWLLGLPGMKVGEKRWLKIPPELAYGDAGSANIPPGAALIFEVELTAIAR
jgi:FKBP-type peptidyl-prolyl cis-trans isomerase